MRRGQPMRILIVDDHALFRKGVASLIEPIAGMQVVGEASSGVEALAKAAALRPDVILMDIQMPDMDGIETTRRIKVDLPDVQVVILTMSDADEHLFEAIKSGAQGYLLKGIDPDEFIRRLEGLQRGEAPISRLSAARILEEFSRAPDAAPEDPAPSAADVLTPREVQVLGLVAEGATNRAIATDLAISENTVKNHLSHILAKLHLRSRTEAAAYAVRERLLNTAEDRD